MVRERSHTSNKVRIAARSSNVRTSTARQRAMMSRAIWMLQGMDASRGHSGWSQGSPLLEVKIEGGTIIYGE